MHFITLKTVRSEKKKDLRFNQGIKLHYDNVKLQSKNYFIRD